MPNKTKNYWKAFSENLKKIFEGDEGEKEKTEMAEATMEDGTVVTAEAFEVGQELFLKTDVGDFVVAPAGEYVLSDGMVLTVDDLGLITEVVAIEAAEPEAEQDKKDEKKGEFATKKDLEDLSQKMLAALGAMSTAMAKAINPKTEEKKEMDVELKARIEAAKSEFSDRRKKITDKKDEKKDEPASAQAKEFRHVHVNPNRSRVQENMKDFDFAQKD